jgi:hypothetical protein
MKELFALVVVFAVIVGAVVGAVALGAVAYCSWRISQRDYVNRNAWPYGRYRSPFPWHRERPAAGRKVA